MKRTFVLFSLLCPLLCIGGAAVADESPKAEPNGAPRLSTSPRSIDFAEAGGSEAFRITNDGDLPLEIKRIQLAPDAVGFQVADPGAQTIAPGQSIEVKVSYAPQSARKQS